MRPLGGDDFSGESQPGTRCRPRGFRRSTGGFNVRPELLIRAPTSTARRGALLALALAVAASPARASMFSGDTLDAVANGIAWFVLAVVPLLVIALFWIVHVMPEKIAYKRHHPQAQAIHTLCLLSLVFGGLLWPLAWIWAYTKPVIHKMAYGTDKASHEVEEEGSGWDADQKHDPAPAAALGLHERLARLEQRGVPAAELTALHANLDALEAKLASEGR